MSLLVFTAGVLADLMLTLASHGPQQATCGTRNPAFERSNPMPINAECLSYVYVIN